MRKENFPLLLKTIICIILFIFPAGINAQNNSIRFSHISLESGLSQATIFQIIQDKQGFLWIATADGLNRYDGYQFKVYNVEKGNPRSLSNGYVLALYEDQQGYIWAGTRGGGLNRFDPAKDEFLRYQHDPQNSNSLINDTILCLSQDLSGNLWVGTEEGLDMLDVKSGVFTHYTHDPQNSNSLSHNRVLTLYESPSQPGILWVGTQGGGLNRLDMAKIQFTHYQHDPDIPDSLSDNKVTTLYEPPSKPGMLWIGTDGGGLNIISLPETEKEDVSFTHYKHNPENPKSLSHNFVTIIYQDRKGKFWICTGGGGLNRLIPGDKPQEAPIFIHYKKDYNNPSTIGANFINAICEDRSGIIWFGCYSEGISKMDPQQPHFIHYKNNPLDPNSLGVNSVRCIMEDKAGILWVGTFGGGLNKFNQKTGRFSHYKNNLNNSKSISHNRVFSLYEDRSGDFWIGTDSGGLNKLDRVKEKFIRYQTSIDSSSENRVNTLLEDAKGVFWVGTRHEGLYIFDREKGKFIKQFQHDPANPSSLSNNDVYLIQEDREGEIWICTFGGGLNKFDREKETFLHFTYKPNDPHSISDNKLLCMIEGSQGIFWIGTYGGGLNRFDKKNNRFTHFSTSDGLPSDAVYGILEDDQGNLWLSTNKGICKFTPESKKCKNYDFRDGLQSNEFNGNAFFKNSQGKMFFGGINGFNEFNPNDIVENPFVPPIVITDFQLFNRKVPIGKMKNGRTILTKSISNTSEIELSHRDRVFSFEFVALNYTSTDKNQYKYIMEGLEDEWNLVGNRRFATYTTIPSGEYIFRVKGSNNDGVWNEEGVSLKITMNPPFWQTWWFYTICIAFVSVLIIFIYKMRVRSLEIRKKELEELVNQRTLELQNANTELEKLSIVARETDNAVMIMDNKGNIEWTNEGATRLYEITLQQLIQTQGQNLVDLSVNPNIKDILNQCVNQKVPVTYESLGKTKSGKELWTQTSLTPILDSEGKVEKIIGIDADITELKKANEIAKKERMAAEMANQSKSEFLARMSHEIRTPMNGVIGFTDMLLDTDLTEEQVDYAMTISRSGEALITLLNDILDFSKIEAGELTFDPIDFDPEVTVFDICDLIMPRIGTKPIELLCRIGDNVPAYVRSDAGRFRQVIVNLMSNASKFTMKGEIELSLEVEQEVKEKLNLHVKVRDTGIGISKGKMESVFEAFQQADGSTTRNYGGTGLGLTICKQISALMGGDVWAESEEGKGSTFHFTCWVDKAKKGSEKKFMPQYLEEKQVLIVDDNPTNLEILTHTLSMAKMRVIPISKPLKVVPVLFDRLKNKDPIDICIIDIQMPGFSGYDLAKEIRALSSSVSKLPLLAFSSSTISRSKTFKDAGFNGFLPKPIRRKKLIKVLERLLVSVERNKVEKKESMVTQHSVVEETKHAIHILLVEDNPINLKLALFILEKAGYQVTVADNGKEAVDIFSTAPEAFDIILMDIQMPVLDGRSATGMLRNKGFKEIPIIAMTAEAMKGDREKCIEAGMDDYISKPLKRDVIFKMVKKWCLDR
jgi:PAS domain S-box-containing protein